MPKHNAVRGLFYQNKEVNYSELARKIKKPVSYIRYYHAQGLDGDAIASKATVENNSIKTVMSLNGNLMSRNQFAKVINKSATYVRYCTETLKLTGDEIVQRLKDTKLTKSEVEDEKKTREQQAIEAKKRIEKEQTEKEKQRLIKIMSVPINPMKDAYLSLSIQAFRKDWNFIKEVRA